MFDEVRKLLDNPTLDKVEEPVALYFSYADVDRYPFYQANKAELVHLHNNCRDQLIEYLLERSYLAASNDNPLAQHPATIVVSHSGIQTPFLSPFKAKKFAEELGMYIERSKFAKPLSKIFAIRVEQLPPPVLYDAGQKPMFTCLKHPDGRLRKYIRHHYGRNFIKEQYNQAWQLGEDNTLKKNTLVDPNDLSEPLYSGRKLAIEPFYSYARDDMESRYQVFATPFYSHAAKFCGSDNLFGLIQHYQKAPQQKFYDSYDLEAGGLVQLISNKQIETAVVPSLNPVLELEMFMNTRSYLIPDDEERWIVFKEYCRAAYIPQNKILKQRRINILLEAKQNGGQAVCYMPIGLKTENLLLEKYQTNHLSLENLLLTPPTKIRKQYHDFKTSLEISLEKVRKIKNQNTSQSSIKKETPAHSLVNQSDVKLHRR